MIDLTTVARGDRSRIVEPRRAIARTPADWQALWAAHAGPDAAPPAVDFATHIVAAAFAGERPSTGYTIEIVAALEEPHGTRLIVDQRAPAAGTIAAQIFVYPFHVVALPRTGGDIWWTDSTMPGAQFDGSEETRAFRRPEAPSSTGLAPRTASMLAYLAGPLSGVLILLAELTNQDVRFHAWQSILAIGGLGLVIILSYVLAFAALFVSATGISLMVRVSIALWIVMLVVWLTCLWKAFSGQRWKLPLVGEYAERLASRPPI